MARKREVGTRLYSHYPSAQRGVEFAFGVRAVSGGPEGLDIDQQCYYLVLGTGSLNPSSPAPCALLQLRNSTHQYVLLNLHCYLTDQIQVLSLCLWLLPVFSQHLQCSRLALQSILFAGRSNFTELSSLIHSKGCPVNISKVLMIQPYFCVFQSSLAWMKFSFKGSGEPSPQSKPFPGSLVLTILKQ